MDNDRKWREERRKENSEKLKRSFPEGKGDSADSRETRETSGKPSDSKPGQNFNLK